MRAGAPSTEHMADAVRRNSYHYDLSQGFRFPLQSQLDADPMPQLVPVMKIGSMTAADVLQACPTRLKKMPDCESRNTDSLFAYLIGMWVAGSA